MKQPALLTAPTTRRRQPGRDSKGRFTKGNPYARLGWAGLVERRFNGDATIAKEWLGRVGVNSYARQFTVLTPMMRMRLETVYAHPGSPEEFAEIWYRRVQPALFPALYDVVSLADVQPMEF